MRAALRELLFTEDKLYPPRLGNLAAWFDALDTSTMLSGNGSTITDGGAVALWGDKSGNSGVNCLVLPGSSGNYAQVPDSAALSIAGDIDIIVAARLVWTTAANLAICSKIASTAGYGLGLGTGGYLRFQSGIAAGAEFVNSSTTHGIADYAFKWARATRVAATGVVTFYLSDNGTTWTQLGTPVSTTAGNFADGTEVLAIGASPANAGHITGNVHRAIIKDGIGGTTVLDIDFSTSPKKLANGDTFTCATGQTVTLNSSGATGARIAGERDLYQGTAANRPVYLNYAGTKYGYLNGTAGNYFSTPDSVAAGITGDIDLIADIQLSDYTPSSDVIILAKYTSAGNQRAYYLSVLPTGALRIGQSTTGGDFVTFGSTASLTTVVSDNARIWVRGFLDVDNGAAGRTAKFYTSTDGATWTQLGSDVVVATAANTFDSSAILEVGSFVSGTAGNLGGRVFRAQVWSGNSASGGTLKADFNPALYTSGTTFTASTGEVWTINGGAHIVTRTGLYFDGSNDYWKTAAFSLSQPETAYWAGEQTTWTGSDALLDGNSNNTLQIAQFGTTPELIVFIGGSATTTSTGNLPLKTGGLVKAVFNAAASSIGVNRISGSTGTLGAAAGSGVTVGANGSGAGAFSNAFVSEVAIYSAAHATATQDRWALYAGRRHSFAS